MKNYACQAIQPASHISAIERKLSNQIKIESQLNFLHPSHLELHAHTYTLEINSTDFNGSFPSAKRSECASIDMRQLIEWTIYIKKTYPSNNLGIMHNFSIHFYFICWQILYQMTCNQNQRNCINIIADCMVFTTRHRHDPFGFNHQSSNSNWKWRRHSTK